MKAVFAIFCVCFISMLSLCNLTRKTTPSTTQAQSIRPKLTQAAGITVSRNFHLNPTKTQSPFPFSSIDPPSQTLPVSRTPIPALNKIVSILDSPELLEQFMRSHFVYREHNGCYSFDPETFFRLGYGNCKDFATFVSYVLDENGYDTHMITFNWYTTLGVPNGHVVVIFKDKNGELAYFSNDTIIGPVDSIDDLLNKEKARFGAGRIGVHYMLPPGARNLCKPE